MSGQPWIKFYPRDWRGDQALRLVSLAARGLWMEMLCVMHEASPYGHLLVGGQPVGDAALARLVGTGVEEVQALLVELRTAGVLRQTRGGVIYSKRMTDDHKRSVAGRKAKETALREASETKKENPRPSRSPASHPTTQKPEARDQKEEDADASSKRAVERSKPGKPEQALVERLWSCQPVTGGKRKATRPDVEKALSAALARGGEPAQIEAAFRAYYALPDCRRDAGRFAMGGAVLLNEDRWKDFAGAPPLLAVVATSPPTQAPDAGPPELRRAIVALPTGGEQLARGYFDPCKWDAERRRLVAPNRFIGDRLERDAGPALRDFGATVGLAENPVGRSA